MHALSLNGFEIHAIALNPKVDFFFWIKKVEIFEKVKMLWEGLLAIVSDLNPCFIGN